MNRPEFDFSIELTADKKYEWLEWFYHNSLFPFLDELSQAISEGYVFLNFKKGYSMNINGKNYLNVTFKELKTEFLKYGNSCSGDIISCQFSMDVKHYNKKLPIVTESGALLVFQYQDGYYRLADDWFRHNNAIEGCINEPIPEKARQNLVQDIMFQICKHLGSSSSDDESPNVIKA